MQNLTVQELDVWERYINRRGSLNVGLRIEEMIGLLIYFILNLKGVKDVDLPKLTPHTGPAEQEELTEEEIFKRTVERFKHG